MRLTLIDDVRYAYIKHSYSAQRGFGTGGGRRTVALASDVPRCALGAAGDDDDDDDEAVPRAASRRTTYIPTTRSAAGSSQAGASDRGTWRDERVGPG